MQVQIIFFATKILVSCLIAKKCLSRIKQTVSMTIPNNISAEQRKNHLGLLVLKKQTNKHLKFKSFVIETQNFSLLTFTNNLINELIENISTII